MRDGFFLNFAKGGGGAAGVTAISQVAHRSLLVAEKWIAGSHSVSHVFEIISWEIIIEK